MYYDGNACLKNVYAYKSKKDNRWYLKLVYSYEDDRGLHEVTYPKVEFSFTESYLPIIDFKPDPHIETLEASRLFEDAVIDPRDGKKYTSTVVDILVKPKTHKMTIEEIEKKLGYKVAIVSNKED